MRVATGSGSIDPVGAAIAVVRAPELRYEVSNAPNVKLSGGACRGATFIVQLPLLPPG